MIVRWLRPWLLLVLPLLLTQPVAAVAGVMISEIRVDQTGADNDE